MADHRNGSGKRRSEHSGDGGRKRRNSGEEKVSNVPTSDDTIYRYLCPGTKIGSIIGRGGEVVKQLRAETQAKIKIAESIPGSSDERVVTISSSSKETNLLDYSGQQVCPAQDALLRVHDRLVNDATPGNEQNEDDSAQITVRLLIPSDQIGCVIGKGGQVIQQIRGDSGAQVRVLKNECLPACALSNDELVQIIGDSEAVKKALYDISSHLHDNPSSQHLLAANVVQLYRPGGQFGGHNNRAADWSSFPHRRDESFAKDFKLRLVCPAAYVGSVIGKGGSIINQIRQESRATIKVDSSNAEDECTINISAKEVFEDTISPTIDAAVRLQPRCSEKTEQEPGEPLYTTRLLVPKSRIGCLIGKGGSIISEMRRSTRANIRILSEDNKPKVASDDDEMVQITAEIDVARNALLQITTRLRANLFDKEALPLSCDPYQAMPASICEGSAYLGMDSNLHGRLSYLGGYSSSDVMPFENHGNFGDSQSDHGSFGAYGGNSSRSGSSRGYAGFS